jgi:hypothetical protein
VVQVKKAAVAERPNRKTTRNSPAIFRIAFQLWLDINNAARPDSSRVCCLKQC